MKIKKLLALALSAVMAVGVLTACGGGGGSSVSGSLSNNEVNRLLKSVGSGITVENDTKLNNAVRSAASEITSSGSTSSVQSTISSNMKWSISSNISNAIKNFISSGGLMGIDMSYGSTYVIEENQLKTNTSAGGIWSSVDNISSLEPINTPEKFAAAMVLVEESKNGWISSATNNVVRFTYNVSASKAKTSDGTVYWVFAAQVNVHLL